MWSLLYFPLTGNTSKSTTPQSAYGCQLPLHRGAVLSPRNGHRLSESSRVSRTLEKPPLCKGRCRVAAEGLWNCPVISRSRATSASLQPLSQPMAVSSPYTGEPFSARQTGKKSCPHLLAVTGGGFGVSFWCEEESCSRVTVAAPFPVLNRIPNTCEKSIMFL